MHERGLVADVVREAERVCHEQKGTPTRVQLTIGALSGLSAGAIDHYFRQLASGSSLEGVELDIHTSAGLDPARAATISLDSVDFRRD